MDSGHNIRVNRFRTILQKAYTFHFIRYSSVGVLVAIVINGLFFLLKGPFGMDIIWANRIAYIGGLVTNFVFNKLWTFGSKKFHLPEILLYLLSWATAWGIQFALFRGVMDGLGWSENIAQLIAYPIYGLVFFLLCKYVAFNPAISGRRAVAAIPVEEDLEAPTAD